MCLNECFKEMALYVKRLSILNYELLTQLKKRYEWEICPGCGQMAHDVANRCNVQTNFI